MIRTFIALSIPEAIKNSISQAMIELKARNRSVRWVKPEALHITLKFLGDISEESVAPLSEDLDRVASSCPALELAISGFGAFPGVKRPRVVWVGLAGDIEELIQLASDIDKMCTRYSIAEESRPFSGHITLGRLKAPSMVDLSIGPVTGMFSASQVMLYRSVLLPGGAQHTVLHRSSLGGKGG